MTSAQLRMKAQNGYMSDGNAALILNYIMPNKMSINRNDIL